MPWWQWGANVRFTNSDPWNHHVRLGVAGAPRGDVDGQSILLEGKAEGKPSSSAVLTFDKLGAHGAATVKVWHVAQLVDKTPLETSVSAAPTRITFPLNVVSRGSRL
jgi:hypothetical protein